MASQKRVRRSGRVRQPTNKLGATGELDVDLLGDEIDNPSDADAGGKGRARRASGSSDDFAESPAAANGPEDDDGDGAFSVGSSPSAESEESSGGAVSSDDSIDLASWSTTLKRTASRALKGSKSAQSEGKRLPVRNRGLSNVAKIARLDRYIQEFVGTSGEDALKLYKLVTRWASDPIAPGRKNLEIEARRKKAEAKSSKDDAQDWYSGEGASDAMQKMQDTRAVAPADAAAYYPRRHNTHRVLMGPYGRQTLFEIPLDTPLHLSQPWKQSETQEDAATTSSQRTGWMLNLGAKIQCLAWAPNQESDSQYLAVSITNESIKNQSQSSFDPRTPYNASIQIWAIPTGGDGDGEEMNENKHPVLIHAICASWGMCIALEWCPGYRVNQSDHTHAKHLGVLAGIWTDGSVRALDIRTSDPCEATDVHVLYQGAAFVAKPPRSICTSLTWISDKDLAVGCANGQVAVWDIAEAVTQVANDAKLINPSPYYCQLFHNGYVLGLAACSPGYPYLLVSTGTDGYVRLTDLRDSDFDTVFGARSRIYPQAFAYCRMLDAVITPEALDTTSSLHIRRFYQKLLIKICEAPVSSISCSPVHPCSLIGMTDGTIVLQNLANRMYETKKGKYSFEVKWFQHEWIAERGVGSVAWYASQVDGDTLMDDAAAEDEADSMPRLGISRITEAYAPTSRGAKQGSNKAGSKNSGDSSRYESIYEESSAITSISWNPNPRFGGWVAAGMGSGLLRVEDLAV